MALTALTQQPAVPARQELWMTLHGGPGANPYESFAARAEAWPLDFSPDFDGANPVLQTAAAAESPGLIVEVGVWKGLGTRWLAAACPDAAVLAVDTFCGNVEHWLARDPLSDLPYQIDRRLWHHGRPALYQQFLANMLKLGLTERVIPFAITSVEAARWMAHHGFLADLVYLDAGHSERDVDTDLRAWWPIVAEGGALVGHDYGGRHQGVQIAADRFAASYKVPLELLGGQFYRLRKSAQGASP